MLYVAAAATVVVVAVAYLVASDFVEDLLELLGRDLVVVVAAAAVAVAYLVASDFVEDLLELLGRDLVVAVAVVLEHRVQVINICEEVLQDLQQEFVFR